MAGLEARAPWARLAALTVAVVATHAWLLGSGPRVVHPGAPAPTWITRTIAPVPTAAASLATDAGHVESPRIAAAPATPAKATPAKATPAKTTTVKTPPVIGESPSSAPAAPAAPVPAPRTQPASALRQGDAARAVIAPPVRLNYDVTAHARGITLDGSAQLLWRHDGREYEAQWQVKAPLLPTRSQHSAGAITPEGLAPKRFSDKSRHEEAAHFEREAGTIVFSSNKPTAPLAPGAQDRLSVMLQLGALIAAEPRRYPAGTSIEIQTASTRDAEPWTFTIDGMQTLEPPGGTVEALKLTRLPRREYDVKVDLWLAPNMAYVPVRLRLTQPNGDWVDQLWRSTDRP